MNSAIKTKTVNSKASAARTPLEQNYLPGMALGLAERHLWSHATAKALDSNGDLAVPKVNGFEVLRQIRADESLKMMPVVNLILSHGRRRVRYQLRVNACLVKRVERPHLVNAVKTSYCPAATKRPKIYEFSTPPDSVPER